MPVEARFCPACGSALEPLEPVPPGQERRLVTILFADVTSSTSLGERPDPERLQEVLATYFGAMRKEIEAIVASAADIERVGALIETERLRSIRARLA